MKVDEIYTLEQLKKLYYEKGYHIVFRGFERFHTLPEEEQYLQYLKDIDEEREGTIYVLRAIDVTLEIERVEK